MNSICRLVPWTNWDEWVYVKKLLFSDNINNINEGIMIVDAWKVRAAGLPVSVDSTALFSSLIHGMEQCEMMEQRGEYSNLYNGLMYAAALAMIRMVNGMIDVEQKGVYSKSINVIAMEIGLPRFFVDLRHRCTHNDIPSFDVLLSAVRLGKQWLFEHYWQKQEESLLNQINLLLQQLVVISHISSTNTDTSTFNKKGEVAQIIKNIFINTSTTDIIHYMIPSLIGNPMNISVNMRPLILPEQLESADSSIWLNNWSRIFVIAYGRWNGFLDCVMENISLFVSSSEPCIESEWMLRLAYKLTSPSFYALIADNVKKEISRTICTTQEMEFLGYNGRRYVSLLLKARDVNVLQFMSDVFGVYLTKNERELQKIRGEMVMMQKERVEEKKYDMGDELFSNMKGFLDDIEKKEEQKVATSTEYTYDLEKTPIGTLFL